MYYRTPEERDYSTRHAPFFQLILDGEQTAERCFDLNQTE